MNLETLLKDKTLDPDITYCGIRFRKIDGRIEWALTIEENHRIGGYTVTCQSLDEIIEELDDLIIDEEDLL